LTNEGPPHYQRPPRPSKLDFVHKPFSAWGEIFGDEVTAVATIDRLVRHAEILSLKGDSYRLQGKDLGGPSPPRLTRCPHAASPYGLDSAGATNPDRTVHSQPALTRSCRSVP
jgi:hypothetical protein